MVTAATMATMAMSCRLSMGGLLSGLAQCRQGNGDNHHRGNQKNIPAEKEKTGGGGNRTDDGGGVVVGAEPLLHKNGDEQGGEDEFDALVIDGDQRSCQGAKYRACHPVDLVEEGDQEAVAVVADPFGGLTPGNQGISFVRQGKNKVGLLLSGTLVGSHHGDAVKQVPGIDHQSGQRGGEKSRTAGEEADGHVLHGTGIDEQTHGSGPGDTVAALLQQDAESEAQEDVAGHHGNGVPESGTQGGFVQKNPFFRMILIVKL